MVMREPGAGPAANTEREGPWEALRESVRDCGEGFAATDPRNAGLYRRDIDRFCEQSTPQDEDGLLERYAEAADLRERWGGLFVERLRRIAR